MKKFIPIIPLVLFSLSSCGESIQRYKADRPRFVNPDESNKEESETAFYMKDGSTEFKSFTNGEAKDIFGINSLLTPEVLIDAQFGVIKANYELATEKTVTPVGETAMQSGKLKAQLDLTRTKLSELTKDWDAKYAKVIDLNAPLMRRAVLISAPAKADEARVFSKLHYENKKALIARYISFADKASKAVEDKAVDATESAALAAEWKAIETDSKAKTDKVNTEKKDFIAKLKTNEPWKQVTARKAAAKAAKLAERQRLIEKERIEANNAVKNRTMFRHGQR